MIKERLSPGMAYGKWLVHALRKVGTTDVHLITFLLHNVETTTMEKKQ